MEVRPFRPRRWFPATSLWHWERLAQPHVLLPAQPTTLVATKHGSALHRTNAVVHKQRCQLHTSQWHTLQDKTCAVHQRVDAGAQAHVLR